MFLVATDSFKNNKNGQQQSLFLWLAAMAVAFANHQKLWGTWICYASWMFVQIAETVWLQYTIFNFLGSSRSAILLYLGAMIAGVTDRVPMSAYWSVFLLTATSQALRYRMEVIGTAHFDTKVRKEAPYELLVVLSAFTLSVFLCECIISERKLFLAGVLWSLSFVLFCLLPAMDPVLAALFLNVQPNVPRLHFSNWRVGVALGLIQMGDIPRLFILMIFTTISWTNLLLMGIEDTLFPNIFSTQWINPPSFITGHPRSGTTSLHESVLRHKDVVGATFFDLFFSAFILKMVFWPIKSPLNLYLKQFDTPNHRVSVDEPVEDPFFLTHIRLEHINFLVFKPWVDRQANWKSIIDKIVMVSPEDVTFMKRCIQRVIVADRFKSGRERHFVGRPLAMTKDLALLRQAIPKAKYVVCDRPKEATIKSWVQLIAVETKTSLDDESFRGYMQYVFEIFSKPTYEVVNAVAADDDSSSAPKDAIVVPFEDWIKEPHRTFEIVLKHLNLSTDPSIMAPCVKKTKVKHVNDPRSAQVVSFDDAGTKEE